jgi:hypothetical protein
MLLTEVAPAFVEMAHRIVWCTAATVDPHGRPRSRILHPYWEFDGTSLVGWVGTSPTPVKRAHLAAHPYVSCNYWASTHDTCRAECAAELLTDDDTCERVWQMFRDASEPVGYDPAIIEPWREGPRGDAFAVLRLDPWQLRVMAGAVMLRGEGTILTWSA